MPLRNHEHILVFYKKLPVYNPQMTFGKKRIKGSSKSKVRETNTNYGGFTDLEKRVYDENHPQSVIEVNNADRANENEHPTQKPLELMRYLVRTYSNENDLVFDGYSGSGTTAAACIKEKRRFIGSELSKEYFDKSVERLELLRSQPELF
jgi:site-specific DNA-methyltransferase (adenine-specific)